MNCGEIWLVDLDDARGHEQRGTRPGVILGSAVGISIIVPLTSNMSSARFPHTHQISPTARNGLDTDSIALAFQIVSIDNARLRHRIGIIDDPDLQAINALLKDLLQLD
jgi:mRNA interferase MazF